MAADPTTALSRAEPSAEERRQGPDRRRHSWRTLTYCGLAGRGRRRHARRQDHSYYLDRYDGRLVLVGVMILVLSCLDAMLTLTLLGKGAYEANYLMARLLETGITPFILTKIIVTAAGVLFLLIHAHFRILRITSGKQMLNALAGIYGLLIGWEIVLLGVIE